MLSAGEEFAFGVPVFLEQVIRALQVERRVNSFARNALDKGSNHPGQGRWNGAREGDGLDLHVEPTVALFKTPIGIQAP